MGQTMLEVRLPTEAEWEYSCRAGTASTYHSGNAEDDLDRVAWYLANSKGATHPVGQKEPNAFNLYDLHGNVWQWCQDWYSNDYYGKSETENPQGPAKGTAHVLRGGAWICYSSGCGSTHRAGRPSLVREEHIGFRVVVVPAFRSP
jgi:sulfatase modifying factor 1